MTNKRDYAPITYSCNGATVDFPFSWKILYEESVVVSLIDSNGETTTLNLGTDYTVEFDEVGGNVKTKIAYETGNTIVVGRNASMYQEKSFSTSGGFQASEIENAFDTTSINLQDMDYNIKNFKETFSAEIGTKIETYRNDVTTQIETNKQEILNIQSDFKDEVNTKIQQVSDAAAKINQLEDAVNTAVTSANTATEKANMAGAEVEKAKAEVTKATEQVQIATETVAEAKEVVNNKANIDLDNLSDIGKNVIKHNKGLNSLPYTINSCEVDEVGEPNLLQATAYVSKIYATPGTYSLELEAGDYEVEMYGAGGGDYSWSYQKASGHNGGGSGAGFKGVVSLPKGTYTLTVGATNATGNGGDTSINDLIICGGGQLFTGGYANYNTAKGGTITISPSLQVKESILQSAGNDGYRQWYDGGGSWIYNEREKGGLSLYDNSNTGYGAGRYTVSGLTGNGIDGFIQIKSLGEEFSNLNISDFTATDKTGVNFTRKNNETVSVLSLTNADYNIYMGETGDAVLLNNKHTIKKYAPENPNIDDVWVNSSVLPISVQKWNGEIWEVFDKNYLGSITVHNTRLTKVVQPLLNVDILHPEDMDYCTPDYSAGIALTSATLQGFIAPQIGIITGAINWNSSTKSLKVNGQDVLGGNTETSSVYISLSKGDKLSYDAGVVEAGITRLYFYPLKGANNV